MNRQNLGKLAMLRPGGPNANQIVAANFRRLEYLGPSKFLARKNWSGLNLPVAYVVGIADAPDSTAAHNTLTYAYESQSINNPPNCPIGCVVYDHSTLSPEPLVVIQVFGEVNVGSNLASNWIEPDVGEKVYLGNIDVNISDQGKVSHIPGTYCLGIWMGSGKIHLNICKE